MSIKPSRTFEQIQQQVGTITGHAPSAWWVGTDKTLAMRDAYFQKLDAWREEAKTLAVEHDCDPEKNWVNRSWGRSLLLAGFTPNDLQNPHKALRHKTGHSSNEIFVPNRRTTAGKELHAQVELINNPSEAPSENQEFTGYSGQIMKPMGDGRTWRTAPTVAAQRDTYPILSIGENPDDNPFAEAVIIDPDLWERIPASWCMRIIEEGAS